MSTPVALMLIFATWVPAWLLMERLLPFGDFGLLVGLLIGNSGALLAVLFAH